MCRKISYIRSLESCLNVLFEKAASFFKNNFSLFSVFCACVCVLYGELFGFLSFCFSLFWPNLIPQGYTT